MFHLLLQTPNSLPVYEWVFQHLQLIGWPTLCLFAWKASKYFERLTTQATKTVSQIDSMATNHFPHMEASLATQDRLMESMNDNLKIIADNSFHKH